MQNNILITYKIIGYNSLQNNCSACIHQVIFIIKCKPDDNCCTM